MPAYIYFIIAIVVIALIVVYLFTRRKSNKGYSRHRDSDARYSNTPIHSEEKRALAHGAILAHFNGEQPLVMQLTKREDDYIYGLRNQWGITDRDSAIKALDDLMELKKSKQMDKHVPQTKENPEFQKLYEQMSAELNIPVEELRKVDSTYAWDTTRAISIARWSFWTGYITEEEAWSYIVKASSIAQSEGKNWGEYTCSFLLGRLLHGFDIDGIVEDCGKLLRGEGALAEGVYAENSFK